MSSVQLSFIYLMVQKLKNHTILNRIGVSLNDISRFYSSTDHTICAITRLPSIIRLALLSTKNERFGNTFPVTFIKNLPICPPPATLKKFGH